MLNGIYGPSGKMKHNVAELARFPEVEQCFSSDGGVFPLF